MASRQSLWYHKNRKFPCKAIANGTPTLKFLPEKIEDERTRLNHVMHDFSPSNRNEAVSLLDNLRHRDGIRPDAYKHYNDKLAESLSRYPKVVDQNVKDILNKIIGDESPPVKRKLFDDDTPAKKFKADFVGDVVPTLHQLYQHCLLQLSKQFLNHL